VEAEAIGRQLHHLPPQRGHGGARASTRRASVSSSTSRARRGQRTGRKLFGGNQFGILGRCVIWPTGGRGSALFGATYPLCNATWRRTIFSPKEKIGFTVELRNRTICFLPKLMALRPFLHHSYSLAGRNQRGLRGLRSSSNLEVKITWRERLRVQARSVGASGLRKSQFLSIG